MDVQLLESLLYREESEALDFKRDQYLFDRASEDERAEILKDLLAFANAWRTTDAYILVGVAEVRGNRGVVHGVTEHLLNRNLQQFVQSKTNRPLTFSYSGVKFEGRDVGIITIPVQDRPLYLLKDFGQLKANVVYIRRGDTTGIAAPDEVFKMGRAVGSARKEPALTWEFADLSNRVKLGSKVEITSEYAIVPPASTIPSYGRSAGIFAVGFDLMANSDYYVEIAEWVDQTMLLKPLGLAITNAATVAAEEVILTLEFDAAKIVAVSESNMPIRPSRQRMPNFRPFTHWSIRQLTDVNTETVIEGALRVFATNLARGELEHQKGDGARNSGLHPDGEHCAAQICMTGHVQYCDGHHFAAEEYCRQCGAPCIDQCRHCGEPIRGTVIYQPTTTYQRPSFCHACGRAYPWLEERLRTARELLNHDDKLTEDDRQALWPDLQYVMSNPKADLAPAKRKLIDIKLGKATEWVPDWREHTPRSHTAVTQ